MNAKTPKYLKRVDAKKRYTPTPEKYLQIWDSSATLIGQLAIVTLFVAILGGIPLSGAYPFFISPEPGESSPIVFN